MMSESRRYALSAQLDIEQILLEAQHRWLRPAEICEILQNYKKFRIAPEPPNRPPSGSLFLFDRKVLRYFRKDGHNWRKKKDGKTVKEAHERLKAGSVDVLHCYYAHGEDDEVFQRRSYWMLEEELSHIVLVHYREVKGNRTNYNRIRDADGTPNSRQNEDVSNSDMYSSAASRFQQYDHQGASQVTDTTSLNSTQASEREDAESAYRHQASPGFQSIHELQSPSIQKMEVGSSPYYPISISNNYQGQIIIKPATLKTTNQNIPFGCDKMEETQQPTGGGGGLECKHAAMLERFSNRHLSRLSGKPDSDSASTFESTQSFLAQFSQSKLSIESRLSQIRQQTNPTRKPDLDAISLEISVLEKFIAESSYFSPPYEVRTCLHTIGQLKQSVDDVTSLVIPKKKFSFNNKPSKKSNTTPDQKEVVTLSEPEIKPNLGLEKLGFRDLKSGPGFRNRENEALAKEFNRSELESQNGEFTLSNLRDCEVRLKGCLRALFMDKLKNCKVYVGAVMGSVLIDGAEGCVFVLASHQIRVHNAKNCDFYLRVRSRPIIEDSCGVRFAPYCLSYQGIEKDLTEANLGEETGNWMNVDDFRWLRAVQSPNWSVLPENERISSHPGFQSIHELQSPSIQKMEVGSSPYYPISISNNYQGQFLAIPGMSYGSIPLGENNKIPTDVGLTYELHRDLEFSTWENVVESSNAGFQSVNFEPSVPSTQSSALSMMPGQDNELLDQAFTGMFGKKQEVWSHSGGLEEWQASGRDSLHMPKWSTDQKSDGDLNLEQNTYYSSLSQPLLNDLMTKLNDANQVELCDSLGLPNTHLNEQSGQRMQNDFQSQTLNAVESSLKSESNGNLTVEDKTNYPALRQPLLDGVMREGLRKLDSFDRWMSKELGDVAESTMQPGSGVYWETVGNADGDDSGISIQVPLENYFLSPSLSQDQLFSIIDFSPNWAYSGSEIKVFIFGRFLRNQEEVQKHRYACMFGEIEVPAQIVEDGVFRCHTPSHETGRVPFYITCLNRLACSEVREFEFRASSVHDVDLSDLGSFTSDETLLHMRFGKLLSLTSQASVPSSSVETSQLCAKISALLKNDTEWERMLTLTKQDEYFSADKVKDQLLQKLLKEKLHVWLVQKFGEGGKGPGVLDEGGQGVLHFAAALGYVWAIPPTIAAGVSVNFRDVNGWTALHWAAYYGRERTVGFLISLCAAPGALTDPTPIYPSGRTPSDLAASNGHKGIAGYLAESSLSSLSSHLSSLDLKDSESQKAVETVSERIPTPVADGGDLTHELSLKDSLAAVRNATQAAARIHQVFRLQSFQMKQREEYSDTEFGLSNERALSLIAGKSKKAGQRDEPVHTAAIRIQNKFRSWKGRKDFLLIRKRIIKIQAHVRGHQVRKNYRKIIWSVGILDKIILRWRRKGRGLSGFKPEAHGAGTSMVDTETKEDDYDFLKEGRKQTEERLQKALARVKSMVKYPDAQDQYRRLLNVVSEMQETKANNDKVLNNPEVDLDDDLNDFETLLDDDTFMPTAS